ncbi:mutator type transposase [Tanacetum coccineum]
MVACEWHVRTYDEDVDGEHAYFVDLNDMLGILGYKDRNGVHYQYKIPDSNLDFGLKELRNDQDVLNLINHTTKHKLIEIYCAHENTDLEVVFRKEPLRRGIYSDMKVSSDSEDSDWIDEENVINEVEVDMKDFYAYNNKVVSGWISKENNEKTLLGYVAETYDSLIDILSCSEKEQSRGQSKLLQNLMILMTLIVPVKVSVNRPSGSCLKNIGGKWVKQKSPQKPVSNGNLKNIGGKWIKVTSPQKQGSALKKNNGSALNNNSGSTINKIVHISKAKDEETWTVKTLQDDHDCLQTRTVNMLTNSFSIKDIEETIKPNPEVLIRALKDQLQKKYQLGVTNNKIYRAKAKASMKVLGDYTKQYALLRDYVLELQRTNPDTTVKLDVERCFDPSEPTRQFRRIYICLGALKKGFKAGMRDLLGLDGCFMKGQYLMEVETLNSWSWFLTCLGDDLDLTRDSNFTFMSDKQKGLIPAIAQVFPCAEHRFCLRHIHENMKLQFKGDLYKELLWNCASATSMPYFEKHMDKLRKTDEKTYEWLQKIPPQHWSRAHFSGRAYCDMLLNNICEVFNRELVDERDVPIITCLEFVREYLMKRIVKVQQVIDKSKGPLTPAVVAFFKAITDQASFYKVLWNGEDQYQVMGPYNDQCVVDVKEKTCSFTWKKVYSYKINPLNGKDLWKKHPCPNTLIPPKFHPQIGRPPKKRKKYADELSSQKMTSGGKLSRVGKTVTCQTCKKPGHNKRSCKSGVGGSQPSQMSAATPTTSQASVARGPRSSQKSAATPRASQRNVATLMATQRSAATPRTSQMSAATGKGKEKVV